MSLDEPVTKTTQDREDYTVELGQLPLEDLARDVVQRANLREVRHFPKKIC